MDSTILAAVLGVGGLVAIACWAVFYATREKYLGAARAVEVEAAYREAEVVRLSTPPPPPKAQATPVAPLEPFMAGGSVVPPPPPFLFELPKQESALQWPPRIPSFFPPSPSFVPAQTVLPPPARVPDFSVSDEAPETPRTEHSAMIAQTMRPPAKS